MSQPEKAQLDQIRVVTPPGKEADPLATKEARGLRLNVEPLGRQHGANSEQSEIWKLYMHSRKCLRRIVASRSKPAGSTCVRAWG